MGLENHEALVYGYRLGGPADGWIGLASELVRYNDGRSSWTMPEVSWSTEAMREENHPDHFAGAAEDRLKEAGLGALQFQTYSLGWDEEGHILAAVVHEPAGGPLILDPVAMGAATEHDASLTRALTVLELRPRTAKPEWIMASYYA
ncbi:hypothetical protein [Streptomyces sp. RKAG337]|uniref:hypothetical protein n=1 Tax=Streptomyces sp. RKAG337 TaxID=2893404 RepID=UPI002034A00D|nr:hypothetical protein [Streptomyces sp. RKAG337]MCM2430931.1 hypothetical protein [Streptomyces sp. RKAG337]